MNDSVPPLASRPASPAAPAFQDSSMGLPTLREVLATPRPTSARSPFILHWGPVPLNDAQAAGATFPTSSVVLIPHLPTSIVVEAVREIPSDVLPRCDDTVSSLVSRLSQSSFLEDSRVLQGGRGPRRVRLNDTDYAQPRRRSWSVKVDVRLGLSRRSPSERANCCATCRQRMDSTPTRARSDARAATGAREATGGFLVPRLSFKGARSHRTS